MALQDRLDKQTTDEEQAATAPADNSGGRDQAGPLDSADPFLMEWQTENFDVDDEAIERGLSLLIAATNLL